MKTDLYHKLQNYTSEFAKEQVYQKQMLEFLATCSNPFDRMVDGHFTASAFLLNSDRSRFLLMHHRKLDRWLQPGGHCDGNSNLLEVAIKEAREESGIKEIYALSDNIYDIDIHLIPQNAKEKQHYHYDVRFLLQTVNNDSLVQNKESKSLLWADFNSLDELSIVDSLKRMISKYSQPI